MLKCLACLSNDAGHKDRGGRDSIADSTRFGKTPLDFSTCNAPPDFLCRSLPLGHNAHFNPFYLLSLNVPEDLNTCTKKCQVSAAKRDLFALISILPNFSNVHCFLPDFTEFHGVTTKTQLQYVGPGESSRHVRHLSEPKCKWSTKCQLHGWAGRCTSAGAIHSRMNRQLEVFGHKNQQRPTEYKGT